MSTIDLDAYTYDVYVRLHRALNGMTTYFMPVIGTRTFHYRLKTKEEFERKIRILRSMEGKDYDNADELERDAWLSLDLRAELLLIEYERYLEVNASIKH